MIRTLSLALTLVAAPATAQTLDVFTLEGGVDVTIQLNSQTNQQDLVADGAILLSAPSITRDLPILGPQGEQAAVIVYAASDQEGCAASPYVVSADFGVAWPQGPIGIPCLAYLATARTSTAAFISPPDLGQDGDAVVFDLRDGVVPLGPIVYAPQETRGWDALDAEVGGYSDLSTLDLYAAAPVYDALVDLWGPELFIFGRHLSTRTVPIVDGNFLLQSGCLSGQCGFTLGLLAVDVTQERVYSAYFNEGAPDVRPPLEEWSAPAQALFDRWREGEFR